MQVGLKERQISKITKLLSRALYIVHLKKIPPLFVTLDKIGLIRYFRQLEGKHKKLKYYYREGNRYGSS